jgi:hypothetical protein
MVKYYMQGRAWAQTPGEAVAQTYKKLRAAGYIVTGPMSIRPCLVQHRKGTTWWEWLAEVIEIPGGGEGNDGRKATQTDCIKTT